MVENTPFNDEWNKLQKTFWDNVSSNFTNSSSDFVSGEHSAYQSQQSSSFDLWLTDVDKCWQDHAQVSSTDIDTLYKKLSSSSRFFFNFTESVSSIKQDETAEVLIEKYLEGFANKTSDDNASATNASVNNEASAKNEADQESSSEPNADLFNSTDINAFWKLPLENTQQHAAFFTNQQQSLNTLSSLFEDTVKNPEFYAAVKAYLVALQEYQLVFFNLFIEAAKQAVETLKTNNKNLQKNKSASPKQIMTIWLEVLETNYMLLISEDNYSQAYAEVVNSWMLMVSKSNKPFAEFMQTNMSSEQSTPNDPR